MAVSAVNGSGSAASGVGRCGSPATAAEKVEAEIGAGSESPLDCEEAWGTSPLGVSTISAGDSGCSAGASEGSDSTSGGGSAAAVPSGGVVESGASASVSDAPESTSPGDSEAEAGVEFGDDAEASDGADDADDELDDDDESVEGPESDGSAQATPGVVATAAPTPSAMASAPTRPMYLA